MSCGCSKSGKKSTVAYSVKPEISSYDSWLASLSEQSAHYKTDPAYMNAIIAEKDGDIITRTETIHYISDSLSGLTNDKLYEILHYMDNGYIRQ